jgi:hypothetical protein
MLLALRDELQVWPYWDATIPGWDTVSIKSWRTHAQTNTSMLVRRRLDGFVLV